MSKNKEAGSRDIEATAFELLESEVRKTGGLLTNEVTHLITSTSVIEQLVQSVPNPTSQGQ